MKSEMELRKFPRVEVKLPVKFKEINKGQEEYSSESHSINISQSGMCLYIDKFISLSHRLVLEVKMPMHLESAEIIAKVIWEQMTPVGMMVGIKFLEMKKDTKKVLEDFMGNEEFYYAPQTVEEPVAV